MKLNFQHYQLIENMLSRLDVHCKHGDVEHKPDDEQLFDIIFDSMAQAGFKNSNKSEAYSKFLKLLKDESFSFELKKYSKFLGLTYNFVFHKHRLNIIQKLDKCDVASDEYFRLLECLIKIDTYLRESGLNYITSVDLIKTFDEISNDLFVEEDE